MEHYILPSTISFHKENSNNNNESSKYDNDEEDDGINNLTKIPEGKYITFKEEVDDDINNTKQYFQEGK